MTIYNQEPRPRVLFEGISEQLFQELSALVPTAKLVSEKEEIQETEYDLVVTQTHRADGRHASLHVLSIGSYSLGVGKYVGGGIPQDVARVSRTRAIEASIPQGVDNDLKKLLERTVIATLPEGEKTGWRIPYSGADRANVLLELGVDKLPYVISWQREDTKESAHALGLPSHAIDIRAWFVWFLKYLHGIDPQTFPGEAEWASSRKWATAKTTLLHDSADSAQKEVEDLIANAEVQVLQAQTALHDAAVADTLGMQRLLTADGEELEFAVTEALTQLGFGVRQMDDHHDAVNGAKLEDLRVTDPEDAEWISLVEIKGYLRGVKTNDINQITGKPLISYSIEVGQYPAAVWHIVNFKRSSDPGTRGEAVPNDLDLAHLAELGGTLIDTRQLFLAVRDVQLGDTDADTVRKGLRGSLARWDYRKS